MPTKRVAMSKHTLYEALRPVRTILNLYGVNWRAEKNIFWKMAKMLSAAFFVCVYLYKTAFWMWYEIEMNRFTNFRTDKKLTAAYGFRVTSWLVNCLAYLTCSMQWKPWDDLVRLTKACYLTQGQYRRIKSSLFLFLYAPFIVNLFLDGAFNFRWSSRWLVDICKFHLGFILRCLPFYFLTAVALYVCAVAYYVRMTWKACIEEGNEWKSNLRSSKKITALFAMYYRLVALTGAADQVGSLAMYVIRASTALHLAFVLDFHREAFEYFGWEAMTMFSPDYDIYFFNAFLLAFYLRLALATNQMMSSIGRVLIKTAVVRNSRWSTHHKQLKIELERLIQFNQFVVNSGHFTFYGEAISGESLFSLCAEIMDKINCVCVNK